MGYMVPIEKAYEAWKWGRIPAKDAAAMFGVAKQRLQNHIRRIQGPRWLDPEWPPR